MTGDGATCPTCGDRLATKGLSFFMISVAVDKHTKASPKCRLRVDLNPADKTVQITRDVEHSEEGPTPHPPS